ncbi:unnamed protein product [Rotaria socialis]|uniref:Uncharacterized protein n=1 Tax=Rotaria socialis TaxID=392032 RepID=A0A818WBY6_9BILA|nr:unnamed protein product [Rotaria socialis]CAF3722930.1 unnamed protein product [Rotaria socialis]
MVNKLTRLHEAVMFNFKDVFIMKDTTVNDWKFSFRLYELIPLEIWNFDIYFTRKNEENLCSFRVWIIKSE